MEIIGQLLTVFGPAIMKAIAEWQDANDTTALPTVDQLNAHMQANADGYLAEIAEWRASHPDA
jgi:hypothetical protein